MVEYIRQNPGEMSFRDAVAFAGQQRRRAQDEQLRQQEIDRGERTQRLDATLARDLSGAEGTAGTLARAGFGSEALGLQQRDESRREEDHRNAMIALASYGRSGNPAEFQNFKMLSQRAGVTVPPEVLADTRQAGLFAQAALIADRTYTDPRQAIMFTRAYVRTGGDLEKSANVAGAPRDKPQWSMHNVMRNGQQVLALIDSVSSSVKFPTYQGPDGQPQMVQAAGASGQDGRTATIKDAEWLMRQGIAKTAEEAWELATLAKQNPGQAAERVWTKVYSAMLKGFPPASQDEAAAAADLASRHFVGVFVPSAGSRFAPPPQPTPQPQPAQPESGPWYDPRSWFDGGSPPGVPAQAPVAATPNAGRQRVGPDAPFEADLGGQPIFSEDGHRWYFEDGTPVQ